MLSPSFNLNLGNMGRLILTLLLFASVFGLSAKDVTISGRVLCYGGESPAGAKITVSSPDDFLGEAKAATLTETGEYSFSFTISDWAVSTRLYDFKIIFLGYTDVEFSKVISNSFRLADIYLKPSMLEVYKPKLDLLAQNEPGVNIVAWERTKDMDIDYYIVYKKNDNSIFDSVGTVAYTADNSIYKDSFPSADKSDYYRIEAVFNNGDKSLPSNVVKSFFLDIDNNDNQIDTVTIMFDVALFEGLEYPADDLGEIELQRSIDGGRFETVSKKSLENVKYSDVWGLLPNENLGEAGIYQYRTLLHYSDTCYPGVLKSDSGPFSQSISNLAESIITEEQVSESDKPSGATSVSGISSEFAVEPNPATDGFTIYAPGTAKALVYGLTGEVLLSTSFSSKLYIASGELFSGIYLISVSSEGETKVFRQVVK